MSRANQLILRNAAFLGPAGAAGAAGTGGAAGPTGPAGVVIVANNLAASAQLNNITAATPFSLVYNAAANYFTANKILRARWSGFLTTGAAQQIAFTASIGGVTITHANWTVPTAAAVYHFKVELVAISQVPGVNGQFAYELSVSLTQDATTTSQTFIISNTPTTINTTAAATVQCTFASTVANNTAVCRTFVVEAFN